MNQSLTCVMHGVSMMTSKSTNQTSSHLFMMSSLSSNSMIDSFYSIYPSYTLSSHDTQLYLYPLPHLPPNCNPYHISSLTMSYYLLYANTLHLLFPLYHTKSMPTPSCELSKINSFSSYTPTTTTITFYDSMGLNLLLAHPKILLLGHLLNLSPLRVFSSYLLIVVLL